MKSLPGKRPKNSPPGDSPHRNRNKEKEWKHCRKDRIFSGLFCMKKKRAEGNTRTTAVFFIKYLRTLGFDAANDIFAENAWYFRNALVRANYNDLKNGIHETTEFLELFLRNLLMDENHPLYNRTLTL